MRSKPRQIIDLNVYESIVDPGTYGYEISYSDDPMHTIELKYNFPSYEAADEAGQLAFQKLLKIFPPKP
jgi:hypothetical protein